MESIVINTLKYATQLENAGFPWQKVDAQANLISAIVDDKMATKQDLREFEFALLSVFAPC